MKKENKRNVVILIIVLFFVILLALFQITRNLNFKMDVKNDMGVNKLEKSFNMPIKTCDPTEDEIVSVDLAGNTIDYEIGEATYNLKGVEYGCFELPGGLQRFDEIGSYPEGSTEKALVLTFDINTKNTNYKCFEYKFRLGNSEGRLLSPNTRQLSLPGSGGCAALSYTTFENQKVYFIVPESWSENFLFMGEPIRKVVKISIDSDSITAIEDKGDSLPENLADFYEEVRFKEEVIEENLSAIPEPERYSLGTINGYPNSIASIVNDGECSAYVRARIINNEKNKIVSRKVELISEREEDEIITASELSDENGYVDFIVTSKEAGITRLSLLVDDKDVDQVMLLEVKDSSKYNCENSSTIDW